jgi:hypothetical protein
MTIGSVPTTDQRGPFVLEIHQTDSRIWWRLYSWSVLDVCRNRSADLRQSMLKLAYTFPLIVIDSRDKSPNCRIPVIIEGIYHGLKSAGFISKVIKYVPIMI